MQELTFCCVGLDIRIACDAPDIYELLADNFGDTEAGRESYDLDYVVRFDSERATYLVDRGDSDELRPSRSAGELIYVIEGDLVMQLQFLRADLLFLHSAVLQYGSHAHLLVGRSGAGKSTTCWGLLHHGFRYVSDELAPIALDQRVVFPYYHALCMKSAPPGSFPIPTGARFTDRGVHVPSAAMPAPRYDLPLPVGSMCFIEFDAGLAAPTSSQIGHAEAATRLFPNILNALAHDNDGLAAARRLTEGLSCFLVGAAALPETCRMITGIVGASR